MAQILAILLTIGIEIVHFILRPKYKWVRGKIIIGYYGQQPQHEKSIEEELLEDNDEANNNKGRNTDDESSSSSSDDDRHRGELISSIDQLKKLSEEERSVLRKSRIGMSLRELDCEMEQQQTLISKNDHEDDDDDDELDMFEKLDKRLRRAYAELTAEDVFVVPKNEKYVEAKVQFEDFVNL